MRARRKPRLKMSQAAVIVALLMTIGTALPALARMQDAATSSLSGLFTVAIAEDDIPSGLADGPLLIGRWTLALADDGTYALSRQDVGDVARGTYESGPASLTFREWRGIVGCDVPDENGTVATYGWREVGDQLALTPVTDACPERLVLLASRPLGVLAACQSDEPGTTDVFVQGVGTPAAAPAATGVAAQEGYGEGEEIGAAIDRLLQRANGCWATVDADSFMSLHSQGLLQQIAMMGPSEDFRRELLDFMQMPLSLRRIGDVTLDDPRRAWAYVEVNLAGQSNPQRVNFVEEDGRWRFDSFVLFGPPLPGLPTGIAP
jgi:hypothetical protein